MQLPAVKAGIDADKFWSMTYGELIVQAEGNESIRKREIEEKAFLDYKQAQLQAYAFNEPKKMPKFSDHYPFDNEMNPVSKEGNPAKGQQQDWQIMKARMIERTEMIKATRERNNSKEKGG